MNPSHVLLRLSIVTAIVLASLVIPSAGAANAADLRFEVQPVGTVAGDPIGKKPVDRGGVQVAVVDGAGRVLPLSGVPVTVTIGNNPGGGSLSGTTTRTTAAGVAVFDDLKIDKAGFGYTLVAQAPVVAGGVPTVLTESSASFDIVPADTAVEVCTGAACAASATNDTTSGSVVVDPSTPGAVLMVKLDFGNLDCDGYEEPKSSVLFFHYSGPEPQIVTYVIAKGVVNQRQNTGVDHFEVCYGSNEPFKDKAGADAQFDAASGLFEGLLPGCDAKQTNAPCVISKTKDGPGNVVLKFKSLAGDPQAH